MLVILLSNGMSAFGLKVINAWGLPESAKFPYLTLWYAGGLTVIVVPMLFKRIRPAGKDLAWGLAMAALSMGGQISMAAALNAGTPGHVVFPVAVGGSVLVVLVVSRLFFGERLNQVTAAGVVLGFSAVVLLSVS